MRVALDLPELVDFEYTGEYRAPRKGEFYLDSEGEPIASHHNYKGIARPILRKKKWELSDSDYYFFIADTGTVVRDTYNPDSDATHQHRLLYGNAFPSVSVAMKARKRIENLLSEFRDNHYQ